MSLLYCLMPSCVTAVLVVIVQNGDGYEVDVEDRNKKRKCWGCKDGDVVAGEILSFVLFSLRGMFFASSMGEPATKSASSATKVGFQMEHPATSR